MQVNHSMNKCVHFLKVCSFSIQVCVTFFQAVALKAAMKNPTVSSSQKGTQSRTHLIKRLKNANKTFYELVCTFSRGVFLICLGVCHFFQAVALKAAMKNPISTSLTISSSQKGTQCTANLMK